MKREQRVKGEGGWGKVGEELKGQRRGEKGSRGKREGVGDLRYHALFVTRVRSSRAWVLSRRRRYSGTD